MLLRIKKTIQEEESDLRWSVSTSSWRSCIPLSFLPWASHFIFISKFIPLFISPPVPAQMLCFFHNVCICCCLPFKKKKEKKISSEDWFLLTWTLSSLYTKWYNMISFRIFFFSEWAAVPKTPPASSKLQERLTAFFVVVVFCHKTQNEKKNVFFFSSPIMCFKQTRKRFYLVFAHLWCFYKFQQKKSGHATKKKKPTKKLNLLTDATRL